MGISRPRALLLLLSAVLAISSLSRGCAAPSPVYDTDGHELSADAGYYVLPAAGGSGGGLTMAPNGLPCPLFVAQETDPLRAGFAVRFTPLQGADRTVRVGFDVGVHFDAATTCVQTTEWHVPGDAEAPPPLSGPRHVVTGPVLVPSPTGREKAFRVEKHSHGYKLVWCGGSSAASCQDLGVFRYDGSRRVWLGVTGQAHVVVFKKAPSVIHA